MVAEKREERIIDADLSNTKNAALRALTETGAKVEFYGDGLNFYTLSIQT